MSATVKLYDLDEHNYPNKRGDHFRTVHVFKCPVCGALTNEVVMGGYPGYGVRTLCPNGCECWHHILEHKIQWLESKPHPEEYKRALESEVTAFRDKYKDRVKNDIVGTPDMSDVSGMTNTSGSRHGTFCLHGMIALGTFTEKDIEFSERMIRRVKEAGPDPEYEALIKDEHPHVKTQARSFFYGFDAAAILFPNDEWGPNMQSPGEGYKRALATMERVNQLNDVVLRNKNLLKRSRFYQGDDIMGQYMRKSA